METDEIIYYTIGIFGENDCVIVPLFTLLFVEKFNFLNKFNFKDLIKCLFKLIFKF